MTLPHHYRGLLRGRQLGLDHGPLDTAVLWVHQVHGQDKLLLTLSPPDAGVNRLL